MATSLFDRVANIVEEIGIEKKAAYREKRAGSKDMGNSSHASDGIEDDNEQEPSEGAHSADNERIISETVPNNVVDTPDATAENAPKYEDVSLSQGVASGPTGTDAEDPPIDKAINDNREGDQGGTTHPADANYKMSAYTSERVATLTPKGILKAATELGNDVLADLANGIYGAAPEGVSRQKRAGDANYAAVAGQKVASAAGQLTNDVDKLACDIVTDIVKSAYHQADLVAASIRSNLKVLSKRAAGETSDPTSGAADGEAHGTDGAPPDGDGDEAGLMSAMGGPGGDPGAGGDPGMGGDPSGGGGGMDPQMIQMLIEALQKDPQLAAQLEQILQGAAGGGGGDPGMGGDPSMGGGMPPPGAEMGGMPPGGDMGAGGPPPGGPPPEMAAMGDKQAMQQLGMALLEANIDPHALAAASPQHGAKIASAVIDFQRSGQFEFREAKQGSAERKVRDYMKGYCRELYLRSRR